MGKRVAVSMALAAVLACPAISYGVTLSWGTTSDLPNGVLGVGGMAFSTQDSRVFLNPGNAGFDVKVAFFGTTASGGSSGFNGGLSVAEPTLGGNYVFFQSNPSDGQNFAWVELTFYAAGTTTAVDVLGLQTRIEDVERGSGSASSSGDSTHVREYLIGPKVVSGGTAQQLSFSDTSIFDLPAGTLGAQIDSKNITFNGLPETVSRAVPGWASAGGTQAGKYVGIDLSLTPVSYFRIGESRLNTNSGSVLIGSLGDIVLAPAAGSTATPLPRAALGGVAALAVGMLGAVVRRRGARG